MWALAFGHDLPISMLNLYFISINQKIMKSRPQVEDLNQQLIKIVTGLQIIRDIAYLE